MLIKIDVKSERTYFTPDMAILLSFFATVLSLYLFTIGDGFGARPIITTGIFAGFAFRRCKKPRTLDQTSTCVASAGKSVFMGQSKKGEGVLAEYHSVCL